MYLIVYDIQSNKLRSHFSKFLKRYGRRVQYSVFEIENSPRILENVKVEILSAFEKRFTQGDSVLIYDIGDRSCVGRFGYPANEETDLVIK